MGREKSIQEEIQKMAPTLASLPKSEGYKTPADYWEKLESAVLAEIDIEAIDLPEQVQDSVPEGYFDTFNEAVLNKIDAEVEASNTSSGKTSIFSIAQKFKPLMGIAASLLLVALVVSQLTGPGKNASLQQASLEDFVENTEVFNTTEMAMITDDFEGFLLDDGAVESIVEESEGMNEMDSILEDFFEDEELEELMS